jgi:hypothetical protein
MLELYLQSLTCLHGVVLNYLIMAYRTDKIPEIVSVLNLESSLLFNPITQRLKYIKL